MLLLFLLIFIQACWWYNKYKYSLHSFSTTISIILCFTCCTDKQERVLWTGLTFLTALSVKLQTAQGGLPQCISSSKKGTAWNSTYGTFSNMESCFKRFHEVWKMRVHLKSFILLFKKKKLKIYRTKKNTYCSVSSCSSCLRFRSVASFSCWPFSIFLLWAVWKFLPPFLFCLRIRMDLVYSHWLFTILVESKQLPSTC